MSRSNRKADLYDVSTYTDTELYGILELDDPSDRVLEAKILSMIDKYNRIGNDASNDMSQFFIDVYTRFFDVYEDDEDEADDHANEKEGFANRSQAKDDDRRPPNDRDRRPPNDQARRPPNDRDRRPPNDRDRRPPNEDEVPPRVAIITNPPARETQITNQVDYTRDSLNPLLKQTIKRTISIDSQYRENKRSSSTNFTFNLSEPLKDVVSLKLYSVQIPYTWYTINSSFGGNFFYIKGNSPGIDNDNHDYKIEIPSGNYTAVTLQSSIQQSINGLSVKYPDVSFGNTSISYNSSTVLTTINLNITEVFGETNYYLEFPTWSSPLDSSGRLLSVAGYFGYNSSVYNCGTSAMSMRTIQTTNVPPIRIDTSNNTIQIVVYVGDAYTPSAVVSSANVGITSKADYSWSALIAEINTKLRSNPAVVANRSGFQVIDVSANQQGYGFSYIQLDVKPTRKFLQNYENAKVAVILPSDPVVWVGNRALFGFATQVIELSNVISESSILQTDYIIDASKNSILLECKTPGYIDPENDFNIVIPPSDENGYTLEEYLNAVNNSVQLQNTNSQLYVSDTTGTRLYGTNDGKLNLNVYVNRVFETENYRVKFEGNNFPSLFGQTSGQEFDLATQNVFIGTQSKIVATLDGSDKLVIIPKYTHMENGVAVPLPFVMSLVDGDTVKTFQSLYSTTTRDGIVDYINGRISSYMDLPGSTPLLVGGNISNGTHVADNGSKNIGKLKLTVIVHKMLTYSDYRVRFVSNQIVEDIPNSWVSYLGFNPVYESVSNGVIVNNKQVRGNEITLDNTNNYFYIKSFPEVDGLTSTGTYNIKITLPIYDVVDSTLNNSFTIEEIYEKINTAFAANPLSVGSKVYKTDAGKTVFRFNINKTFRTSDYRLVFYDPFSFVSCYSGATRRGNKTVKNATWDTTVGWILGFRENIIYYLDEYASPNGTDNAYYTDPEQRSNCVLVGDTTVSTNLYNYFLIKLDDYTQNHLNDGLITITNQDTVLQVEPYSFVCDPYATSGSTMIAVPTSKLTDNAYLRMSKKELYTFNQKVQSVQIKEKSYSAGPFVKDIFGLIPMKTAGLTNGTSYVEFGGTLQNQDRMYFGPVNIHRMTIQLLNDRGDLVDLNNSDWSFSLICEQLYKANL